MRRKRKKRHLDKWERRELREKRLLLLREEKRSGRRYVRHHILARARHGGNSFHNLTWLLDCKERAFHDFFGGGRATLTFAEAGELLVRKGKALLRLARMKANQKKPGMKPRRRRNEDLRELRPSG